MNPVRTQSLRSLLIATSASLSLLNIHTASAQNNSPPATATRPAKELPEQTSAPNNNSPPATRTQTTGEASRDPTIQKMNEDEQQKINREGK
ncbi:MAG: hypothetical protein JO141_05380 [Bradyrhizobium sp.]|nr:hypothetical protein [Bradyrhizobium sp.]